jgi:LysR family transcriptional regulator (chromosome initiation inhibitor)
MLESEALAETVGGSVERTRIAIAVNADSMFDMVHCRAR